MGRGHVRARGGTSPAASRFSRCTLVRRNRSRLSRCAVTLKPKNLRSQGLATALFSALTVSLSLRVEELRDRRHHPFAGTPRPHINVAVVGVAAERVPRRSSSLSRSSSRMLDSSGESGPPCGVPSARAVTTPRSSSRLPDSGGSASAPVSATARHPRHQHVVVNPVEELLQVDVHHPASSLRHILLRAWQHRLMRVRPGRKP